MMKKYVSIFNDMGGEALISPATPELIADGWPVCEYDTWTVKHGEHIVEDVRAEARGIWSVPIAPTGVCVTVELISRGAYDSGEQFVGLTRPTQADLHTLENCGWVWDGAFAHKA